MTCLVANHLRKALWFAATQLGSPDRCTDGPNERQWRAIEADHEREDYLEALAAYRMHREGCETCRAEMDERNLVARKGVKG
jgi:hypothetical protein